MKRIEEIWNASAVAMETKALTICDLLSSCEVCGVREQCQAAKTQAEKKTAWETLVKWANEETAKSSKHRASYVQMELF